MNRTLRTALVAALAAATALSAAACGSDDSDGSAEAKGGKDGGKRTVQTPQGPVQVPVRPERVVVLDTAELDTALTLGVKPVGSTRTEVADGYLNYLGEDQVEGIKDVGTIGQPNMEAILALEPDLILTNGDRDAQRYDELSKIAPTVMTKATGYEWKENFELHADALNKKDEAAKVVRDYQARAKEVAEAVGGAARAKETEVSVVRFVEGANIRLYARQSYIGTILADVGLGRPEVQDVETFKVEVSPEKIDKADGDVIFYSTYGSPEKSKEKEVTGGPLWKNLAAVKNDRAFAVNDDLWIVGIGYTAADKILDEMQAHLTA
ncbi:iron-siderophore ABC transporter substrate-binding protein [Wenjunlia vitaminophila]|uniref:Iron-siderophore ABC transporter substrate-binding protein n=1 Tax=Wenjunlia vitaminophila TaxID=76728 RepID=A0A0T6LVF2_WENVI|nr:iron-siderophore ABC transporter substrate-binding protein [Wenjunlia vitaminophila]KRV50075.1 iron-siderophore ABC transporter substrate-binding protein [Wenjunlia vitaminophila]